MPAEANTSTTETPATTHDPKAAPAAGGAPTGEVTPTEALSADINKLIEKARADEKKKQYGKIEKMETDYAASQAKIASLEEQIATLIKKSGEPSKKEEKPPEGGEGVKGITQEQLDAAIRAAASSTLDRAEKEIFGPRIAQLEAQLIEAQKRDEARDLQDYRNRLIESNKDSIIPELVVGSTREELDTALISAKQVFARTAEALTQKQTAASAGAAGKLPPVPSVNGGAAPATGSEVRTMSSKEFAANRDRLLAEASKAAKAALNVSAG